MITDKEVWGGVPTFSEGPSHRLFQCNAWLEASGYLQSYLIVWLVIDLRILTDYFLLAKLMRQTLSEKKVTEGAIYFLYTVVIGPRKKFIPGQNRFTQFAICSRLYYYFRSIRLMVE